VKKLAYTCLILGALSLGCDLLFADDDVDVLGQDFGSEHMITPEEGDSPFRVSAHGDWIQRSKINKRKIHNQYVNFYTATAQAESVVYYNPDFDEGIGLGLGYTAMQFDWDKNHFFRATDMGQLSLSLSGFSNRLERWRWQAQLTASWEPRYSNFTDYTNYDIILWGRHEYCNWKDFHLHIGFWAEAGMRLDHIYPIIGFDWAFSEKWMLNLVFPMNMSLVYALDEHWSAALAVRIFNVRYRFGEHEHLEKALLYYRNGGLELAMNYGKGLLTANIHVGVTAGGRFRISDHENKHKKHFNMDSAAYAGGEVAYRF
jgi:hypothetical protein